MKFNLLPIKKLYKVKNQPIGYQRIANVKISNQTILVNLIIKFLDGT